MAARVIRWLAVIVWLAVIYWFSDQTSLPGPGDSGSPIDILFKKSGHVAVYGVLGVLLYAALSGGRPATSRRALLAAIALAAAYALLDELHQTHVPGRQARITDFAIDVMAASAGAWFARRWQRPNRRNRLQERLNNRLTGSAKP